MTPEEANSELGKRLREKFEGYKAPVKDEVREHVFAALDKSSKRLYWIPVIGGLLLIAALFLGDFVNSRTDSGKKDLSVLSKNKTGNTRQAQVKPALETEKKPDVQTRQSAISHNDRQQTNADPVPQNMRNDFERKSKILKKQTEKSDEQKAENDTSSAFITSASIPAEPVLLTPRDSVLIAVSLKTFTIPPISSNTAGEGIKKQEMMHGVKGIFSASVMQAFQLVHLSPSAADGVQNFQFAPLLSSRSLSYKLTAGVERKNTQLILGYTYLRNWNEYEIGTNRVIATRVGEHQYQMTRIGEKHLQDERSHLLGIGIRQRLMMPQNILKNYSINLGMEYSRLLPKGQDLVWGNIGFYKHIYQSGGARFEIGPYFQYSFTEREVGGQIWKSRPYQVGVSFHIKTR